MTSLRSETALAILLGAVAAGVGRPQSTDPRGSARPEQTRQELITAALNDAFALRTPSAPRIILTIQFVPSFRPEWQIDILQNSARQSSMVLRCLRESLSRELWALNPKQGLARAVRSDPNRRFAVDATLTISTERLSDTLVEFWRAVRETLPKLQTGAVEAATLAEETIHPDGTRYQFTFRTVSDDFRLAIVDEEMSDRVTGGHPLVIWVNSLRLQLLREIAAK